jgi:two-component system KDP operon response regulator KdpE
VAVPQAEAAQPRPDTQLIYVADDDAATARLVEANLSARGYRVKQFDRGAAVLQALEQERPDLMVLDVMMPGINGLEVARRVRRSSQVPILMLTVRDEMTTKVAALDLGADDYLTKPFRIEELLSRVRAILRRTAPLQPSPRTSYRSGALVIDVAACQATSEGRTVKLTPQEWEVLRVLVKHAGQVVMLRQMLQEAWGPDYSHERDYVRAYVNRLRRKLEPDPQKPRHILSERGLGYRLAEGEG